MGMESIIPFIAVAAGGALGALSRFAVYRTVETGFPWATFIVNIVGCCLASFLMFRYGIYADGPMKAMVFTGFFGAFTTMSTFSIDTVNLLVDEAYAKAGANIFMNSVLCVIGAIGGRWLALL
ncbi:fluoride efflux transporter FluC [Candidatus Methanoprimaticola sp. MG2]|uniref:fluoride efflux transporter FluC n=1 Tax=Candidatus Methanoprimaticola sp. MG2 TaxID=3228838 RepID=UPI0039C72BA9